MIEALLLSAASLGLFLVMAVLAVAAVALTLVGTYYLVYLVLLAPFVVGRRTSVATAGELGAPALRQDLAPVRRIARKGTRR